MSDLDTVRTEQSDGAGELTQVERGRLKELEAVIERGKQTFLEVGAALLTIRDERLYRPLTFAAYCQQRWSFTAQRATQLIAASQQEALMETRVSISSEGHMRALRRLPEHMRTEVAPRIADVTVREAEDIVREIREKHGIGNIYNRHPRLIALAEELSGLEGRWKEEMCKELTPPEARKQLRAIDRAMALLVRAREAIEYRAATTHRWIND